MSGMHTQHRKNQQEMVYDWQKREKILNMNSGSEYFID